MQNGKEIKTPSAVTYRPTEPHTQSRSCHLTLSQLKKRRLGEKVVLRDLLIGLLIFTAGLLGSARAAARVELKFPISPSNVSRLVGNKSPSIQGEIYFLDTPDYDYFHRGIILRVRLFKNKKTGDITAKLRPFNIEGFRQSSKKEENIRLEFDRMFSKILGSASICESLDSKKFKEALESEEEGFKSIFTREQREFLAEHAKKSIKWKQLHAFGPIRLAAWEIDKIDGLILETWSLGRNFKIAELSVKTSAGRAKSIRSNCLAFMRNLRVKPLKNAEMKLDQVMHRLERGASRRR
jgi:hypothetical protein